MDSTPSALTRIFLTPDEPRLRAGWRLAGQLIFFLIGLFLFTIPFSLIVFVPSAWLRGIVGELADSPELLIGFPAQFLAAIVSVYLARRLLDRRSFRSLGLAWERHAGRDLLFGITIPGVLFALIFLIEWAFGWLQFQAFVWESQNLFWAGWQTLILFLALVAVGFYEEIAFRGYWLQNLSEGLNTNWGVLLSSAVFALAHIGNPSGAGWPAMAGLLLAGVFFAYSYLRTRMLWLPIGFHIGWNFFEGPVFGFQVSGLDTFRLIEHRVEGPDIWTGGGFGPEAGLVLLPALALGALFVTLYTRNRDVEHHERQPSPNPERK